ncbi:MAG: 4Fe-4S ferredoxin N-terminal domain-containing protein [Halapricum sp.]
MEKPFEDIDLEAAEYDQELGRQMGEDARKVAAGELSQAEFYEKYHEDVLAEFGEDKRDPGSDEGDMHE